MLAHGLSIDMMVVIDSGLATAQTILLVSQEVMGGASEDAPGSRSQRGQFCCVTLRPFLTHIVLRKNFCEEDGLPGQARQ